MPRILAYTSPARGHLYPLVPILDELRRRGHEIHLRTLASQVPAMRARGFDACPVHPAIAAIEPDDWRARDDEDALRRAARFFEARAALDDADLRRSIAGGRPDAVLVDIACLGASSAAEAWGGPWVAYSPAPIPLPSPDAPPFGPGLAPARGPLRRLRDRLYGPTIRRLYEEAMMPVLAGARRRSGLDPLARVTDWFSRPPLLLYMTAEPFEYPRREWPGNVVMVGPCAWSPAADPPAWLDDVTRQVVLVATSSDFQNDLRLVRTALDALADEPFTVVATVPASDTAALHVPPNARVERFVPHDHLLDRAVCAVTHGGMGVTQKALAHGVPVCAVPFGRDQFEVARRVEVARAGTRLPAARLDPHRLRARVREAIRCQAGARRVGAAFFATGGAATGVDAVETRLLARPRA